MILQIDRRERLRKLLTVISPQQLSGMSAISCFLSRLDRCRHNIQCCLEGHEAFELAAPSVGRPKELFYTEGSLQLKEARLKVSRLTRRQET